MDAIEKMETAGYNKPKSARADESDEGCAASRQLMRVARWSTLVWGLLHVIGGALILQTVLVDGPGAALADLGSASSAGSIPADPGPVVEAVVGFHGFNILWIGIAVLFLVRRSSPRSLRDAIFVMAAADIGLVVFLLAPGYMALSEGIWGPALLVVAATSYVLARKGQS